MLLQVSGLRKTFGVEVVLSDCTFRLDRGEKVALVGRNGTGKSTLLKLLMGELEADGGSIALSRGVEVGYLRQHQTVGDRTVLEEAEDARRHVLDLELRLKELEARLEHGATDEDLESYATLHEHFLELEGFQAERDLTQVLQRMGFQPEEFDKPASALSGGERTRLAFAKLLLEEPDLLILDEPTNHLDLQATEWLEGWLSRYPGAALVVSHDKTFLERVANRILELRDGSVFSYPGPYSKFRILRDEEIVRQAEVAKRQQDKIDQLDEYVRRFMNSQRTAQARGRQKQMQKLVEAKVSDPKSERTMKAGFNNTSRSGTLVLEVKNLAMAFGDQKLFSGLDWTVQIGERWGVIGENGVGKSTLMRCVLGWLEPVEGTVRFGSNVSVGAFFQDAEDLDMDRSPLDTLVYECDMLPGEARDLLGRFLLTGDDVFRPVRTLSGGERNKLSLAKLTRENPNLLILDEPTNHLDIDSREALGQALKSYKGTLIVVSHDRSLLADVTDRTLDLRHDGVRQYPGSYEEYRRHLELRKSGGSANAKRDVVPSGTGTATSGDLELSPRELSKEIARMVRKLSEIEHEVETIEADLQTLERTLAAPEPDGDLVALTTRYGRVQSALEAKLQEWEAAGIRLESLRAAQGS